MLKRPEETGREDIGDQTSCVNSQDSLLLLSRMEKKKRILAPGRNAIVWRDFGGSSLSVFFFFSFGKQRERKKKRLGHCPPTACLVKADLFSTYSSGPIFCRSFRFSDIYGSISV